MNKTDRMVVGLTHVDLGWKKGRAEMAEVQEAFLTRLIDLLERRPDFHYLIEQAVHYRDLKARRPDLLEKVKKFVRSGQLEFATGVASTIEMNTVNGECFVRNLQLGLRWIEEEFGQTVRNCALVDTFGIPAQTPQILRQFHMPWLLANRLGSRQMRDVLRAKGLDGSELTVFGRDLMSPYVQTEHICFRFFRDHKDIDLLFDEADDIESDLLLVMPYSENEFLPSARIWERMEKARKPYRFGTLAEFAEKLVRRKCGAAVFADLNPEFTGTFSLRHELKQQNRRAEEMLLEAEKVCAMLNEGKGMEELDDCWWEMAYAQFHDVITGSHPTDVYRDCLGRLNAVCARALKLINGALGGGQAAPGPDRFMTLWNGLPHERTEWVSWPLPPGWTSVRRITVDDRAVERFFVNEGTVCFPATVAAMGTAVVVFHPGGEAELSKEPVARLENEYIIVEFGGEHMVERIIYKPTGTLIAEKLDDLLVLEKDIGHFQIEQPVSSPIVCGAGPYRITLARNALFSTAEIEGSFPVVDGNVVSYRLEFRLAMGSPFLDVGVRVRWQCEAARLRLKLSTRLQSSTGLFEIPFGVVARNPYGTSTSGRGEWPVHRFVVLEDSRSEVGIALINAGTVGAEITGMQIVSTLMRAPHAEYAGMVKDDTSSDWGDHAFKFRLLMYDGGWRANRIAREAQAYNAPFVKIPEVAVKIPTFLRCDHPQVLLSAVKRTPAGENAVRFYESTGREAEADVEFSEPTDVWASDLTELPLRPLAAGCRRISLRFKPFEIMTLLIRSCRG